MYMTEYREQIKELMDRCNNIAMKYKFRRGLRRQDHNTAKYWNLINAHNWIKKAYEQIDLPEHVRDDEEIKLALKTSVFFLQNNRQNKRTNIQR